LSGRPSYLQLLRNRSFGSLWLAQLVSQSGDGVFDVALLWLVFVTTKSTALVGLTQAAVLVPAVFAAPVAGVYVDRLNRRNVMIASNLAQGAITGVLALLYFSGTLAFPALILFVLLLYTGAQFFRAANTAIIPSIVGPGELGVANGLFTLTTSANQLASYTVGGAVVAAIGAGASITYDSLTFFVAAVILTFVPMSYGAAMALAENWQPVASSFMSEFREGLSYIRRSRLLLELIVFGTVVNFFFGGLGALIAPYVNQQLHGDAFDYGVTLSAYALGTIAGSFVVGKVNFRRYVGKLLFAGILQTVRREAALRRNPGCRGCNTSIGGCNNRARWSSSIRRDRRLRGLSQPASAGPDPVEGPGQPAGAHRDCPWLACERHNPRGGCTVRCSRRVQHGGAGVRGLRGSRDANLGRSVHSFQ